MEIYIDDISEEGLTLRADSNKDQWLKDVIKEAEGESYSNKDSAVLVMTLLNCEDNIDIRGEIKLSTNRSCDRCLNNYDEETIYPLHAVMAPIYKLEKKRKHKKDQEDEIVKEDLEFGFYEGDRIDLSEFLREQILLEEPIKHICRTDCKGICQNCGKDLNKGPCKCKKEKDDSRWEALKGFKPKKNRL